jgi:hypothetical protein
MKRFSQSYFFGFVFFTADFFALLLRSALAAR